VLAGNCLTTLQPLGHLKHLTSLDVSHNRLSEVGPAHVLATVPGTPVRPAPKLATCRSCSSTNLACSSSCNHHAWPLAVRSLHYGYTTDHLFIHSFMHACIQCIILWLRHL
jgi:hypothetical protein